MRRKFRINMSTEEHIASLSRKCSICNSEIKYHNSSNKLRADRKNAPCETCQGINRRGIKFTDTHKIKIAKSKLGKKLSVETRLKISKSRKGIRLSDNHKRKLREIRVKELQSKYNCCPNYNPIACKYFDKLNAEKGWKLQHALNGGEISKCGYFLDAYDAINNIAVEYDEKKHMRNKQKLRDIQKQKDIMSELNCKFYRYNDVTGELILIT